ncbi:MAG: cellulose synthase family protein [Acidobacteriota bacterium]
MSHAGAAVLVAYFVTLGVLAVYGVHRLYLLHLYLGRPQGRRRPPGRLRPLPAITVQLPIYNEMYVVERLIRTVCALEYPPERLEIQVLDDSTDDTSRIAAAAVSQMRARGIDIVHLRRPGRAGFKAGALAFGMERARGELLAVLDADFAPEPSFLLDLVDHFADPRVGLVQARWGHLNRDYSLLTRLQAIFLDGHFVIEHAARHRAGRFFNFNGTAGIWRRACIESAGGWQADTLTEDLDLSYRAQLKGWRFVYVADVVAPAELPADIDAFKSQQHRWTRGSVETGLKILPVLLRCRLPAGVKSEAFLHLTNNGAYALMVLLALLIVPAMIIRHASGLHSLLLLDLPLFLLSTAPVSAFYLRSQRELGVRTGSTLARLPLLMALGIGLCLNNSRAILGALLGRRSEFVRTPKHDLRGSRGEWRGKLYRGSRSRAVVLLEALFALYFGGATAHALSAGMYWSLPFLLLFLTGFLYTSLLSRIHPTRRRAAGASRPPARGPAVPIRP